MFNLTIDEAHTFHVGADGWLVHNAGGPGCPTVIQLRANQLAARNGGNSITIQTQGGSIRYDLAGDSHYNKALGQDVPAPHSHTYVDNVKLIQGRLPVYLKQRIRCLMAIRFIYAT